jgi:hypothetical protein
VSNPEDSNRLKKGKFASELWQQWIGAVWPEDEGRRVLRNAGNNLRDYTASYPSREQFSNA